MKVLYFGGQKSGKTKLGIQKTLDLCSDQQKPFYVATYCNEYEDKQMQDRILAHQDERKDQFLTIEEGYDLVSCLEENRVYLIDCISMWIFNKMEEDPSSLVEHIKQLFMYNSSIVFILNEVNCGVIPMESLSRRFIDLSGLIGQELARLCDEVYEVNYGLSRRLK